jgi:hypothetical protein
MAEERPKVALADAEIEAIFRDTIDGKYYKRIRGNVRGQALTQALPTHQKIVDDTGFTFPIGGGSFPALINAISIVNFSETTDIWFSHNPLFRAGFQDNTTDGGVRVGPGETHNLEVAEGVSITIKCESGQTAPTSLTMWI